jgi:hypothetical protein
VYTDEATIKSVCRKLKYEYRATKDNMNGFKETSLNRKKEIVSLSSAISKVPTAYGSNNGTVTWRTYYPCYVNVTDSTTLRFVLIIRPDTDINMVKNEIDPIYVSVHM